jgi:hypothetical protein
LLFCPVAINLEDDMSRNGRMSVPLPVFIGGLAVVGLIALLVSMPAPINTYRSIFERYHVKGVTLEPPTLKSDLEAKYAVRLETNAGVQLVNCDATGCSGFKIGDEVLLDCYTESNWPGSPETECRFTGTLTPAPPPPAPE